MALKYILISIAYLTLCPLLSAQTDDRLTIPEDVKLHAPQPLVRIRTRELPSVSIKDVAPRVDLVVDGTVAPMGTYMSPDQKDLYTDYLVTPIRVIFQGQVVTSPSPGVARPIVVTRWGGRTLVDGVVVDMEDSDVRPLQSGEEVVLLLTRDQSTSKYHLVSDIIGGFSVRQGQLEPLARHRSAEQFRGASIAQLESELRTAMAGR